MTKRPDDELIKLAISQLPPEYRKLLLHRAIKRLREDFFAESTKCLRYETEIRSLRTQFTQSRLQREGLRQALENTQAEAQLPRRGLLMAIEILEKLNRDVIQNHGDGLRAANIREARDALRLALDKSK